MAAPFGAHDGISIRRQQSVDHGLQQERIRSGEASARPRQEGGRVDNVGAVIVGLLEDSVEG
ncbi:hypothetical protein I553_3405 [Mycobacterium xenopi 4042]|uniref:Uncharacterized protein n=1 Tax=Mycobacterium xenopi 4042 TaxID=1299334 RepID=X8BCD2_MYCXE|nr:hypothetical protein I553_3405 [Mycobacterium xenopi 4042]